MKIFDGNGRINFVDDNNVFVGFCDEQNCCEYFGYLFVRNLSEMIKGDETVGKIELSEDELKDFDFDVNFFKREGSFKENPNGSQYDNENGEYIAFRLINKLNEEIYLILYNYHNGYYSHGFEMRDNEILVLEGSI